MSVSSKIRWKRNLNKLRFINEEIELIKEVVDEFGPEFQKYYLEYCVKNNIDISPPTKDAKLAPVPSPSEDLETDPLEYALVRHDGRDFEKDSDLQMTQDEIEMHNEFSKLYKKLATLCHPDTLNIYLTSEERDDKIRMFLAINKALDKHQYFTLLEYAEKNKIPVPKNHEQQIRWMSRGFKKLSEQSENEKRTYNYLFSECETEEQKEILVKQFVKQIFKI